MKQTACSVAVFALVFTVFACETTDSSTDSGDGADVIEDLGKRDVLNPSDIAEDPGQQLDVGVDCLVCEDSAVDDVTNTDAGNLDEGEPGDVPVDLTGDVVDDAVGDGGDDVEPGDACEKDDGGSISPEKPHPMFDFVGEVVLEKWFYSGGGIGSSAYARFQDLPSSMAHYPSETVGDCELWYSMGSAVCEDPCDDDQYCGFDGECHKMPQRIGASDITIEGLDDTWVLEPDDSDWYSSPPGLPDELFKANDEIVVSAGGDVVPAFEVTIYGTGDMTANWLYGSVEMIDDQDMVLDWDVQNDGAAIEVAFQAGWHGAPPAAIIFCSAPESQGSLTVDSYMIDNFPPMGGIGLFPHMSWIRRVNREVVDTPAGPVAVEARSVTNFSISHNAW